MIQYMLFHQKCITFVADHINNCIRLYFVLFSDLESEKLYALLIATV